MKEEAVRPGPDPQATAGVEDGERVPVVALWAVAGPASRPAGDVAGRGGETPTDLERKCGRPERDWTARHPGAGRRPGDSDPAGEMSGAWAWLKASPRRHGAHGGRTEQTTAIAIAVSVPSPCPPCLRGEWVVGGGRLRTSAFERP